MQPRDGNRRSYAMKPEEFEAFEQTIRGVYNFYGKPCSKFALDVWWQALRQFDLAAVSQALGRHCLNPDTGQFLPRPADLMRMLGGSTQDRALVALAKVDRAVRTVGTYRTVVFDDPLIHRVIEDMGGWVALGTKTDDEWPFVGKEFENRYRGYSMRGESPTYPAKLMGICDAENGTRGYAEGDIVLIGNAQAARAVLTGGSDTPSLSISVAGLLTFVPSSAHRIEAQREGVQAVAEYKTAQAEGRA